MGNRGCQTSDEISKISLAALNPNTFLIENHRGITCYGSKEIVIKVKQGSICVCGDHLYLSKMNKTKLVVSGRITAIQIQKG